MNDLKERAKDLGLYGIVANWPQFKEQPWLPQVIELEEQERDRRSLERRIREAKIGHFKPISEFDWLWPKQIDREHVEELLSLNFLDERANVVLVGNNGLGKTMIAQNIAHAALMRGVSTRFIKASDMLNELVECDGSLARRRTLNKYSRVGLLVLDEIGYMNYDNRFADLLYEVISARYQKCSTVVTTNKVFDDWKDIFPNAACVVTLVDRLVHRAETILLDGESYRHKEALERKAAQDAARTQRGRKRKEGDDGQDPGHN